MSQQLEDITKVSTEECSTNFYYSVGENEVFSCQFTVRGNPTKEQLTAHVASAMSAMRAVIAAGGHAKGSGGNASAASSASYEFFKGNKGKTFIKLPAGAAEPNEITCPVHAQKMKRKTNDQGAWYSHKDGDGWCSIAVPDK